MFDNLVEPDLQWRISLRYCHAKMTAWAGRESHDPALLRRAWEMLLLGDGFNIATDHLERPLVYENTPNPLGAVKVDESPNFGTNHQSQWGLNAIFCLELAPKELEEVAGQDQP